MAALFRSFRFLNVIKRSNASSISSDSTSQIPSDTESNTQTATPKPNYPNPLLTENQPHPLFKKVEQTWDHRHAIWSEIQRAPRPFARPITGHTKIVAYNRRDPLGENDDHVWVEFRSPSLVELIRPAFEDVTDLLGSEPGLDARLIYNRRRRLASCMHNDPSLDDTESTISSPSTEDLTALQLLLGYIELEFTNVTAQVDALMIRGEEHITWSLLWAICERGKLMRIASKSFGDEPLAFETTGWEYRAKKRSSRGQVVQSGTATFVIHGRYVQWTGQTFEDKSWDIVVEYFKGTRPLGELPFQPLPERIRKELVDRGRIYIKYAGVHYVQYNRPTKNPSRVMIDEMVVDDGKSITRERKVSFDLEDSSSDDQSSSSPKSSRFGKLINRESISDDDELNLCLLPPGLRGWDFRLKSEVYLYVRNISPIEFNKDAFSHLVLPENHKQMALAFVKAHTREDKSDDVLISDTIKGKGGGMVMLLHGNPGTGKTLTAEAVADYLERPLYSVSCGELNLTSTNLERQLNRILEVAAKWNSVVLIDEADIFLQARNDDIQRSALVSVFLRVLEYHTGVLILTTNRVETFDNALRSRITIALKYPDLDQRSRKILWMKFLVMAKVITDENSAKWEEEAERLSSRSMNGRDIKNAVRSAQTLALEEKAAFSISHIEKVLSIADDFSFQV